MRMEAMTAIQTGTVIPATPLALTADKKLDERGQRLLMRYFLAAGAGGIASGVHSTQFEIHDPKMGLLAPVLTVVADEVARYEAATGKIIVKIAGACGPIKQAVKEAELARKLGYDAVLLSPSGLPGLDEAGHLARAKAVAEVIPFVGFSLQTAVGGPALSFKYWEALAEIDNLVAVKAAPFDRYRTTDIMRAVAWSGRAEKIAMYTGNDDNIVVDLLTTFKFPRNGRVYEKSFVGGLLGHYSVWTKANVELFNRLKIAKGSGNITPELLTVAAKVTDMNAAVFDPANRFAGCISGIHEVLRRQGLMADIRCLSDHEKLSPGQSEELDRVCAMYPELVDDEFVRENIAGWMEGL